MLLNTTTKMSREFGFVEDINVYEVSTREQGGKEESSKKAVRNR